MSDQEAKPTSLAANLFENAGLRVKETPAPPPGTGALEGTPLNEKAVDPDLGVIPPETPEIHQEPPLGGPPQQTKP